MEVGKIDCGAWLTLLPVDEKIGEVRLKIRPLPSDYQLPEDADAKTTMDAISALIIEWNLETDGVAIPCNDESRAKYMAFLFRMRVKADGKEDGEFAAVPIMSFAANIENFLGN